MDSRGAVDPGASRRVAIVRLAAYAGLVGAVFGTLFLTGSLPSVAVNFVIAWPILAGAAGLLFGTAIGTPLALAGVTAASLAQMFMARRLASGHHGSLLPKRTRAVEDFLTEHGAVAVMESRIVPLLPFGLVNFSAGLTRLPYRDLALGTVVGALPKVFAYVALGGSLSDLGSPEAIVAVSLLVAVAVAGAFLVRHRIALGRA
jgi:uncharacterized membrane protein YdjX (TVP38/TMEM64 family)